MGTPRKTTALGVLHKITDATRKPPPMPDSLPAACLSAWNELALELMQHGAWGAGAAKTLENYCRNIALANHAHEQWKHDGRTFQGKFAIQEHPCVKSEHSSLAAATQCLHLLAVL